MEELKFDIYAMAKPKTPRDILALLREFNAEARSLLKHLDELGEACQAKLDQEAVA